MVAIEARLCVRLRDLLADPIGIAGLLEDRPVAVFHEDKPAFYVLSPCALARFQSPMGEAVMAQETVTPTHHAPTVTAPPQPDAASVSMFNLATRLEELEMQRYRRGDLSKPAVGILRNRLEANILPFFGDMDPARVSADVLDTFLERLASRGLTSTTISQYFVIVRKLLKLAVRSGQLKALPEFPKVKADNHPRSMLTLVEYRQLIRTARRLERHRVSAPQIKERGGERERFWVYPRNLMLAPDMAWVIAFMINSFVRPSDIRNLQHKHVQVIRGAHTYLRLTLPESKRHDLPVVTMSPAVRIYEAALGRGRSIGKASPDDYVFLPEEKDRNYILAVLGFWFKWVMREAEVPQVDQLGRQRTLYSLRHTAIMFRLLYGEGIDMLTLARNARTSVQMIERFYASALTGEMNVDMLQSRRRPRQWRRS